MKVPLLAPSLVTGIRKVEKFGYVRGWHIRVRRSALSRSKWVAFYVNAYDTDLHYTGVSHSASGRTKREALRNLWEGKS